MSNEIDVDLSGPLFDGRSDAALADLKREAIDAVAAQTYSDVMSTLNQRIQHPTPYYETQIVNQRIGVGRKVHDRGIVYGPWLEGTSERNRTTRFKGYAAFRKAREGMQAKVPALVRHAVERCVERMGG